MGLDVSIRSLLLAFIVAQVACENIRLTYYDSVTSQYLVSATPSGCYASLGVYPQWCLGNLSRCHQGLTVAAWIKSASDVSYTRQADVILTTGGHSANSDGFFLTRRFSDQYTLGVASGARLWKFSLRLEAGVWVMLGLTWDQAGGMAVFVDGLLQAEISAPEVRAVGQVFQSAGALTVGTSENDEPVTGTCTFSVSDVTVLDNRTSSYLTQNNNLSQQLFQGCLPVAGNETVTSLSGRSGADLLLACRQLCQVAASTAALINGTTCACSNSTSGLVPASACEGKWAVYLVSRVRLATPLTLSLDCKTLSTRGYTRPGEELSCMAVVGSGLNPVVGSGLNPVYKLTFDDGTVMTTTSMPVSYSFSQAGLHVVTVSTQIGTLTLTNRTVVSVDSVDEGQPPQVVGLTVSSSPATLTAICALTIMDPQTSTCVLSFGNGDESPAYTFVTYGSSISVQHAYRVSGAYSVRAYCSNRYGNQSTLVRFLARQAMTSYSYITNLQSLTMPTFGDPLFYKNLVFKVNGSAVAYDVSDAGVASVDNDYLEQGVDNVVTMVAENTLMDRRVLAVRKVPMKPLIKTDKTAGTWNLTVQVRFLVEVNDHLWLTLDFGQGKEGKYLYTPGLNSSVQVDELVYFGALGVYTLTATVSNELGEASARADLSVEVPITEMSVETYNVTSLTQPALFQVSINPGLIGPRTVNFTFNFGDGSRQTVVYHSQSTAGFEPIQVQHSYSSWGIYGVRVLAANNVSQTEEHVTVQVGQNISYLDISTPGERITYGSQLELTVLCPTGSNVLYTVEFGDGTQFSVGEQRPADISSQSNVKAMTDTSAVITHVYTRPGYYKVKVTASNEFGAMKAELCPTIVVGQPTVSSCPAPSVSFRNAVSSWEKPVTLRRSTQNTLTVDVTHDCPVKLNMTFSWTAAALSDASGDRTLRSIDTFCGFRLMNPTLRIEPLTLPFGLYALTVTVSPAVDDLLYTSAQIWVKVIQSEPVPVLDGDPVRTIMTYGTAIFDISGSYDPDLDIDRRRALSFHLFFMPEGELKSVQRLTLEQTIGSSELITNRTIFRTSSSNYLGLYQRAGCFNSTSELLDDLSVFGGRISFAANNFDSSQFSFAVVLWAERNDLSAMIYQIVEVRSSNMSLDDLGSLLDLAKNADPDTAIRLLGGAASAILTQDTSSAEAQEKLAASTEAVVNTLGSVAKRIDSPSQAAKCASAIKTMTSNKDIVSEGSRSSAAGAFVDLANGSSSMAEATVDDASSFAGECLGGLGNIFPSSPKPLASSSLPSETEVTTVLLDLLSTRSDGPTTPSTRVAGGQTSTSPTRTTTRITTPPTPTTTSTSVWSTAQSSIIHTSVGSSLAPTVRASYQNNGDNFTISGVTVASLLLNASRDYTTPQPYQATTALPPTDVTTPLPQPVTVPIDERMFLPRTDPRPARVIAHELLRSLADKDTYRELFQYIFDDCLLFRKVMKSQDIQYNIPCLSTDAINMMKCDGDFTLQDRVFDVMTYSEHPDDIYEVYLVPLNRARAERDRARRATVGWTGKTF
ncbi:uncharacterized protein LOC131950275 [Physella acuta]|uniref:uncharacterized protein LOC131950275 n=1 Tax=Physella acuta TaxID=109671 RepID=UPI0027DBD9CD|nr:uncharacterized protein LOC131950275 [Physella acuta]